MIVSDIPEEHLLDDALASRTDKGGNKMIEEGSVFIANYLDPIQGLEPSEILEGKKGKGLWYKEEIVARDEKEKEYYLSKLDSETKELYIMLVYKDGKAECYCCNKSLFMMTYNQLKSI